MMDVQIGTTPAADEIKYTADAALRAALDVGEYMLRYGGEIHRVEDTIERICSAYGATEIDVFVITSLITATIRMNDGSCSSQIRRVSESTNHLARLEALNALSRKICSSPASPAKVSEEVEKIRCMRPIPEWLCYVSGALATSAFAVFFGGTLLDGLASAAIGVIMTAISRINPIKINSMARLFIMSFLGGVLSSVCVAIGFGNNLDKIVTGTIMLVIPGLAFGNALRDLLCGETLSGTMRFIQTILSALMVALGYMAAFALCDLLPFM